MSQKWVWGRLVVKTSDFIYFLLSKKGDINISESEIMFLRLKIPLIACRIVLCPEWVLELWVKRCKLLNFVLIFKAGLNIKLSFK